ncbi:MAG: hypothetical protein ACRDJG_05270, partial [Actinomycetota bacterium]
IYPAKRYLDWKLEDPAGKGLEAVRQIRDQIRGLVEGLLQELFPTHTEAPKDRDAIKGREEAELGAVLEVANG